MTFSTAIDHCLTKYTVGGAFDIFYDSNNGNDLNEKQGRWVNGAEHIRTPGALKPFDSSCNSLSHLGSAVGHRITEMISILLLLGFFFFPA